MVRYLERSLINYFSNLCMSVKKGKSVSWIIIVGIILIIGIVWFYNKKTQIVDQTQNGAAALLSQSPIKQTTKNGVTQLVLPSNARTIANIPDCTNRLCVDLKLNGQDGSQSAPLSFAADQSVKVTWTSTNAVECYPAGYMALMAHNNAPKIWSFLGIYPDNNQFDTNTYPMVTNSIPAQSSTPSIHYNHSATGDLLVMGAIPWVARGSIWNINITCTDSTHTNYVSDVVYVRNPL